MTAEIAIINKTAVALAADSAITISSSYRNNKVYNSAHKLFEMSISDPIGVMVNNDMHFMETPIPVIIMEYRAKAPRFNTIVEAAEHFREYLLSFAKSAPKDVRKRHVRDHVRPLVMELEGEIQKALVATISGKSEDAIPDASQTFGDVIDGIVAQRIENFRSQLSEQTVAKLVGGEINLTRDDESEIRDTVDQVLNISSVSEKQRREVVKIITDNIGKVLWSTATTGFIVAGFGQKELFPTLVAFDLCGFIGGCVRYIEVETVDIDRNGYRARVIPFAQREMVERFMYGIDGEIFERIKRPYEIMISEHRQFILDQIDFDHGDREAIEEAAIKAEAESFDSVTRRALDVILDDSRDEIEDMVEFMPKSELADMAEALVNITSIKRRVSSGMETVGGPIDVAVISRADGFVWIRHKQYFSSGLNPGYHKRISKELN
jgi:hypothetical protein